MQSCVHSFFFVFLPDRPTHLHEEGGGGGGGGAKGNETLCEDGLIKLV